MILEYHKMLEQEVINKEENEEVNEEQQERERKQEERASQEEIFANEEEIPIEEIIDIDDRRIDDVSNVGIKNDEKIVFYERHIKIEQTIDNDCLSVMIIISLVLKK